MKNGYLERILTAQVYDVAIETPLELASNLSSRIGNSLWIKREDMQEVFSFKVRGAYNKMVKLSPEALKKGVVTASAGNHAQGVALAAQRLNCRATIVMPTTTPQIKMQAVQARGALSSRLGVRMTRLTLTDRNLLPSRMSPSCIPTMIRTS